jgi:cobalt-zinc-cadmium efflux system membrane fusion protein
MLLLTSCQQGGTSTTPGPAFAKDGDLFVVPKDSSLRQRLVISTAGASAGAGLDMPVQIDADPAHFAVISSPLTGRVEAVYVSPGQAVRRGQVLARIASGDFAQARADMDKAEDAADLADRQFRRASSVQGVGAQAVKDVEVARSALRQADLERERARRRLEALNGSTQTRGDLTLTAPFDGAVSALAISNGSSVNDPTAPLITVVNTDVVIATAQAAESDFGKISRGAEVRMVFGGDKARPITAVVTQVSPIIEPDTRRQKIRIRLENKDHRLAPNMFGVAHVAAEAPSRSVWVPQSALVMNNDQVSVLVEVRPFVFQRRAVTLGDETADAAEIVEGLGLTDRIIVRGAVLFND